MPEAIVAYKLCSNCGCKLPATTEYFSPRKGRKNGLASWCKECHRTYARQRIAKPEVKARIREYLSRPEIAERRREFEREYYRREKAQKRIIAYRAKPEVRERQRVYLSEYESRPGVRAHRQELARKRMENPETREKKRQHYREYSGKPEVRERSRERGRKFSKTPKGRVNAQINVSRREARKLNIPDDWSAVDWRYALDYFHSCCAACGRPQIPNPSAPYTLAADHWIPLSNPNCPGTIPANMVPLCHGIDGCNNHKLNHDPLEWLIETFGERKAQEIYERIQAFFATVRRTDGKKS